MAKLRKDGKKKKSGGKRASFGIRVLPENKKKSIGISVKRKLIDSPEKVYKLKMAVYQFIDVVYEKNIE